jgi:hypothetical protein
MVAVSILDTAQDILLQLSNERALLLGSDGLNGLRYDVSPTHYLALRNELPSGPLGTHTFVRRVTRRGPACN